MRRTRSIGAIWAVVCVLVGGRAIAQPAEPSLSGSAPREASRPWANGITETAQARALALFQAGNQEFMESRFQRALAKYNEAIRYWDHPAIRFNMAVSLINLDQLVEAREDLKQSLAFGPAALGADLYSQGITYRKLLEAQLVRVRIVSQDAGAKVSLDGKALFTGPGTTDLIILPGEHQLVVAKTGYMTVSETLTLRAGMGKIYELRATLDPKLRIATSRAPAGCSCYSMPEATLPEVKLPDIAPKTESTMSGDPRSR